MSGKDKNGLRADGGFRTGKMRRKVAPLLEAWLGADGSADAMMKHLPEAVPIAESVAGLVKKIVPPWVRKMSLVRDRWQEIVGESGAKRIAPVRLDGTVLLLELRHPAYRMAFDNAGTKEAIAAKVNAVAGEELCREIRFVPRGSEKS